MLKLPFKQVDVFGRKPMTGNPVAVVLDADGLSGSQMQRLANWTNLSETTFIQKSQTADYRLRIFTPQSELPFAGHPTIGSAHAAIEHGLIPARRNRIVQECQAGLIEIEIDSKHEIMARVPRAEVRQVLGDDDKFNVIAGGKVGEAMLIDVGPLWIVAAVSPPSRLSQLSPDMARLAGLSRELNCAGLTVYALTDNNVVEVRSFAPAEGVPEDPVCGSGNAAVGVHLKHSGKQERLGQAYVARQGMALGRDGRVAVRYLDDGVLIGGRCHTVFDGTATLGGVTS